MKYDLLIAGTTTFTVLIAGTAWLIIFSALVSDTAGYTSVAGLLLNLCLIGGALVGGVSSVQYVKRNQLLPAIEAVSVAAGFGLLMIVAIGYSLSHYASNKFPATKVDPDTTCEVGITATACPKLTPDEPLKSIP